MTVACPLRLVKIALVVPPAVVTAVDIMLKVVIFPGYHYFLIFIRPSLSLSSSFVMQDSLFSPLTLYSKDE